MRSLLFSALLLLAAAALSAQTVNVELDESVDFAAIKTFTVHAGAMRSRDPNLRNPLVEKKIRTAIAARLAAKGLAEVEQAPDVVVYFSLGSREKMESRYFPGSRPFPARRDTVRRTDGTLVIDLRRPEKKELLWRAVAVDTRENAGKVEDHLDKSVEKALKDYPPRKKD